jgi:hypothetical protein
MCISNRAQKEHKNANKWKGVLTLRPIQLVAKTSVSLPEQEWKRQRADKANVEPSFIRLPRSLSEMTNHRYHHGDVIIGAFAALGEGQEPESEQPVPFVEPRKAITPL